jgi:hypothetical protein
MIGQRLSLPRAIVALIGCRLMRWGAKKRLLRPGPEIVNYIEHGFRNRVGERFTLAIVKAGRLTPHELRMKAEIELAVLRSENAELRAQIGVLTAAKQ